jgi:hypothetical protein
MNDQSKPTPSDVFVATPEMPQALIEFVKRLKYTLVTNRENRSERERYVFILTATAKFLKDIEAPIEFADAYVNLARMLEDLEIGKVHPVLERNPPENGAPPDSTFVSMGRAKIALGVVAVMAAGKRQQAAAEYVAKQLGPALDRVRRSTKGKAWKAVSDWHVAFSTKAVKNKAAQRSFDTSVGFARDLVIAKPETDRLAAATKYLQVVKAGILSD